MQPPAKMTEQSVRRGKKDTPRHASTYRGARRNAVRIRRRAQLAAKRAAPGYRDHHTRAASAA
jgi:hypothetical protein